MKFRILVVDDETEIRDMLSRHFRYLGYDVDTAGDGEEALKKMREAKFDIVISDIMMPGIDGWETLTRLKRDRETSGIPVIIFTAREHARGHQKSSEMGAAGYFRKPFEPDELIELVEKHVGQRSKT